MTRLLRDERGVTLVELLAAIFIAVIIFGAAVTTFVTFIDVSTRSDNQTRSQDETRSTLERLSAQARNSMATGSAGATPIEALSDYDFVFLAPLVNTTTNATTNPRGLTHVRYCLPNAGAKNDSLFLQTVPYNSSTQATPPSRTQCPSNTWPNKTVVAEHFTNRSLNKPLFTAINDSTGVTTHVRVRAIVDWNPNSSPDATELFTTINLRNVNRVPTAQMTCQGLANGHIQCDLSGSSDPDGQSLSYSWTRDGTTVAGATSVRLDHSPNVAKSVHTIIGRVTDPGGATATVTKTVTMP